MASREPTVEEKHAFFSELKRLDSPYESGDSSEEDFARDVTVDEERLRWRTALRKPAKPPQKPYLLLASSSQGHQEPTTSSNTPPETNCPQNVSFSNPTVRADLSSSRQPRPSMYPRRVMSDPSKKATSPASGSRVAEEKSSNPALSRAAIQPTSLQRSSSTPNSSTTQLPNTKRQQPPMTSAKGKRKNRAAEPQSKVTGTLFTGTAVYFLPNDDKNPLRQLRIGKVLEGNGQWARSIHDATHIIVEDNFVWKDIERFVAPQGDLRNVPIVRGTYISDCINMNSMVNPNQSHYQIKGRPINSPSAAPDISKASKSSLELKAPQRNAKHWDYVPVPSTPSKSADSSQAAAGQTEAGVLNQKDCAPASQAVPAEAVHSNQHGTVAGAHGSSIESGFNDALSDIILELQNVRDLPLESDDDDEDSVNHADTVGADSDSEAGSEEERAHKRRKNDHQAQKHIAWKDRFACNKGGNLDDKKGDCANARTIEILQRMSDHYERVGDNWRNLAYRKAITSLKNLPSRVTTAREARSIVNIGDRIATKIEEIVTTDRLRRLESAEQDPVDIIMRDFLKIYGVGPAQANRWIAKGFRTLDDLKENAHLSVNQRIGIERYDDLNTRIPRSEVEALGKYVKAAAASIDPNIELVIGGSYRRGAPDSGDIDFIVTKKGTTSTQQLLSTLLTLTQSLEERGFLVAKLAASSKRDGSKWHGCCVLPRPAGVREEEYKAVWRRIDFLTVPESEMGAALIYFTGNDIFNRSIRLLASKMNMRLNQRGLYENVMRGRGRVKVTEGKLRESRDEKTIFSILGVKWREPHHRWC